MAYRVTFYRSLINEYGRPFAVPLTTIEVKTAHSRERAIAAAMRRFERRRRLSTWRDLADMYSIGEDGAAAGRIRRSCNRRRSRADA